MTHLKERHRHHDESPDEYGGLHRDLIATGSVMSRRHVLRMAARLGAGAGVLQLLGCNAGNPTGPDNTETPSAGSCSRIPAGIMNQNYLRGVAQTDANGLASFTSIFPACYTGRWPHIHFEVFASLASATHVANKIATSQIALPKATCDLVYATTGYAPSLQNLSRVTLASDNVCSDGSALELATCTGNVTSGIKASLTIAV